MRELLRARRLDHESAERGQSVAGEMATMIPDPSRHERARGMYRTAVKCLAPFQKRTIPGTGQRIATRTLRCEKGFEILPAGAEIGEGGILADKGMLDAGEIRRENIDRA
jgi:hypothetical protein